MWKWCLGNIWMLKSHPYPSKEWETVVYIRPSHNRMCYLGIWLQCRFRVRPEGLHFWQAPRGQWCSWLEDHTLGLTGEENIYKLAEDTRLVVVWPLPASPAPSPFLRSSYPRIPGAVFGLCSWFAPLSLPMTLSESHALTHCLATWQTGLRPKVISPKSLLRYLFPPF